jgi:steroid delta-isomerase-like uncharacterized protein
MKHVILVLLVITFFFIGCGDTAKIENLEKENANLKAKIEKFEKDLGNQEKVEAILNRNLDLWNNGDMTVLDELYSPDFVRYDYARAEEFKGLEAFKGVVNYNRTAYPDFTVKYDKIIVKGEMVIVTATVTGTNTGSRGEAGPTGKAIKLPVAVISRIVNGKFTNEWIYYDLAYVYKQLGFTITPPPSPNQ